MLLLITKAVNLHCALTNTLTWSINSCNPTVTVAILSQPKPQAQNILLRLKPTSHNLILSRPNTQWRHLECTAFLFFLPYHSILSYSSLKKRLKRFYLQSISKLEGWWLANKFQCESLNIEAFLYKVEIFQRNANCIFFTTWIFMKDFAAQFSGYSIQDTYATL